MSTNTIRLRHLIAVESDATCSKQEGAASVPVEAIAYWTIVAAICIGFGFLWDYGIVVTLLLVQMLPPRRGIWRLTAGG